MSFVIKRAFIAVIGLVLASLVASSDRINVGITFTKAAKNQNLQDKFSVCVSSLLKHARTNINFYIIGDDQSQNIAREIFGKVTDVQIEYEIKSVDSEQLARQMHVLVSEMQSHFSHSKASYYGASLFFLSIGLFKVFDPMVERIILLDADLKFKSDIGQLAKLFNEFSETNVIGIANDAQPVYRHLFSRYRSENKDTRVGSPPPKGLAGFNSGVLLLDLEKMRHSTLYDSLITPEAVERLTKKYFFKGHLGDQDFFSLIGMEHEELFYVLPCTWNRQICTWWKSHGGYTDVFHEYFNCQGPVNIWHGNCNTRIPEDDEDVNYQKVDATGKSEL